MKVRPVGEDEDLQDNGAHLEEFAVFTLLLFLLSKEHRIYLK